MSEVTPMRRPKPYEQNMCGIGLMSKRSVCIVITTRGNYAKMKSTIAEIASSPVLTYNIIVAGGATLDSFGNTASIIENDGFSVAEKVNFLLSGDDNLSMATSAGLATSQIAASFDRLKPDIVIVIADRYEALSISQSALCLNIPIVHLEGGEVSGSIDERIRHAITKLANIHLPSNQLAARRIASMGESKDNIHIVGSPSLDLLSQIDLNDISPVEEFFAKTESNHSKLSENYLVVSQHSVPTQTDAAEEQITQTFEAVKATGLQTIWILPNMDAGYKKLSNMLSSKAKKHPGKLILLTSVPFELYATLIYNSACLIGNSSSGIREAEFLGVPVVNIGTRQEGRQRGENVIDVNHNTKEILAAITTQLQAKRFLSKHIYGDGEAGKKIATILENMTLETNKRPLNID